MTLNSYYNCFDPDKEYEKSLFLAGRGLQSAELNEIQDYALLRLKGIGDAIFRDGDVITGADCIIDGEKVTLEAGKIYLRGAVRSVEKEEFIIQLNTTVRIGVFLPFPPLRNLRMKIFVILQLVRVIIKKQGQQGLKFPPFGVIRLKVFLPLFLQVENFIQFITLKTVF